MTNFGQIIQEHHGEILHAWGRDAARLAAARALSEPELMNIMPRYLAVLARPGDPEGERRRLLDAHLSSRLRAGYRLCEVLEELAILGRSIERLHAAGGDGEALDAEGVGALRDALFADVTFVITTFTQYLMEDEQEERRYLRRLQALAGEGLRGEPPPRGEAAQHLRRVTELVMEAMGAQSAALLLYDAEGRSLRLAGSAGVAGEPLVRYAASEAPASFAALVASREEEATSLTEAEAAALEVSAALRQSGVRALLGVRLPARDALIGVLYVGLTERSAFEPREVRRLETLGEQLALHLDRARLYDDLRATAGALRVERELRERFVAALAHDLRGPLTVVRTSAHLLCGDAERLGEHRELPGRALRNTVRAERMVHDFLDVARVQAGRGMPLTLGPCDLGDVVRDVVEELAAVHGPRFDARHDAGAQGVWDADLLRRALWNLAANAVKYGASDAPIDIAVRRLDAGVEVAVHNDGPVIPPEAQAALFDPFGQLPAGGDHPRHGWGLGLTLVKSCAEAHGGAVRVESGEATGTTFTIELPLDASAHRPAA